MVSTGKTNLVTKTVTGFLDFVTTIGDTVLIFTPQVTSGSSKGHCRASSNDFIQLLTRMMYVCMTGHFGIDTSEDIREL
jgi:hypothetical protein